MGKPKTIKTRSKQTLRAVNMKTSKAPRPRSHGTYVEPLVKCALCCRLIKTENLCSGCGHYVCDSCDNTQCCGSHNLEDHRG